MPETRYARSGDVNIVYQVVGDGPTDIVYVPGWVSNVELMWDDPVSQAPSGASARSPVEDRGTHILKGVPDEWRVYAASR